MSVQTQTESGVVGYLLILVIFASVFGPALV